METKQESPASSNNRVISWQLSALLDALGQKFPGIKNILKKHRTISVTLTFVAGLYTTYGIFTAAIEWAERKNILSNFSQFESDINKAHKETGTYCELLIDYVKTNVRPSDMDKAANDKNRASLHYKDCLEKIAVSDGRWSAAEKAFQTYEIDNSLTTARIYLSTISSLDNFDKSRKSKEFSKYDSLRHTITNHMKNLEALVAEVRQELTRCQRDKTHGTEKLQAAISSLDNPSLRFQSDDLSWGDKTTIETARSYLLDNKDTTQPRAKQPQQVETKAASPSLAIGDLQLDSSAWCDPGAIYVDKMKNVYIRYHSIAYSSMNDNARILISKKKDGYHVDITRCYCRYDTIQYPADNDIKAAYLKYDSTPDVLDVGITMWTPTDSIYVDKDNKTWLKRTATLKPLNSPVNTVAVTRLASGFQVDIRGISQKFNRFDNRQKNDLEVVKIVH